MNPPVSGRADAEPAPQNQVPAISPVSAGRLSWIHRLRENLAFLEFLGLLLAAFAIYKNTESNRVASRALVFQLEQGILSREFESAQGPLLSIYAKPSATVTDPATYCVARMKPLLPAITPAAWTAKDAAGKAREPVQVLYDRFWGLETFEKTNAEAAAMRQMFTHLGTIIDQMHSAYDLTEAMTDEEFQTWRGYISDIGAHPMFLVTIMSWRDQAYISRDFAEFLRNELMTDPLNASVIRYFYPSMATDGFLEGLHSYGGRSKILRTR